MAYYTGPLNNDQGWAVAKSNSEDFLRRHIQFAFGPYRLKKEAVRVAHYQGSGRIELFIDCPRPKDEG